MHIAVNASGWDRAIEIDIGKKRRPAMQASTLEMRSRLLKLLVPTDPLP